MHDQNDLDRKPVSSQQGRDWLVTTRRSFDGAEVAPIGHPNLDAIDAKPGGIQNTTKQGPTPHIRTEATHADAAPTRNRVKITSVTIPDVSSIESLSPYLDNFPVSKPFTNETVLSNPKAVAKSLAEASDMRLGNLAKENNVVFLWQQASEIGNPDVDPVPMEPISTPIVSGPTPTSADIDERPESWIEKHERKENDRVSVPPAQDDPASKPQPTNVQPTNVPSPPVPSVDSSNSLNPNESNEAEAGLTSAERHATSSSPRLSDEASELELSGVIESVIERSVPGESMVIQFVGTEWNRHVDATTATVASILVKRRLGSTLLIDSNSQTRGLTTASGETGKPGLVEAVLESVDWRSLVRKGSASGVDFLPLGKRDLEDNRCQQQIRSLVADFKKEYDYICVSSGSSDTLEARMWTDISDGCYLLVSQTNSNQTLAQSAVAELQASGARLLGCVVTDTLP